ncbi:MAG: hypothetical protein KBA31_21340 [Alphaproteobacteria bacterium]|nr:hypothetical protein [Alphaproteobacteria bacterium]
MRYIRYFGGVAPDYPFGIRSESVRRALFRATIEAQPITPLARREGVGDIHRQFQVAAEHRRGGAGIVLEQK